jgi:hypothetical protein
LGKKNGGTIADFFKLTELVQSHFFSKNIIIVRLETYILNFSSEVENIWAMDMAATTALY